jgi:TPR repeat protein
LGWWRDQASLAWLPGKLARRHVTDMPLPQPPCPAGLPTSVVELARSPAATSLCLDLLAALLHPVDVDEDNAQPWTPWLQAQLERRTRKLARQAERYRQLDAGQRHRLRQRLRRLHDLIELHAAPAQLGQQPALALALRQLGALQDEAVALDWYRRASEQDDRAQAAVGWLMARQGKLKRRARKALQAWAAGLPPA